MEDGELIKLDYIDRNFFKIITDNNFKKIRLHDLGYSHASLLLSQGVSAKAISTRLEHSNISITMDLYSHIYEATNKELANNFDIFLKTS